MKNTLYLLIVIFVLTINLFASVKNAGSGTVYTTLSNAVIAAASGDTLLVSTGVYFETIDIYDKNLVIDGTYKMDFSGKIPDGKSIVSAPRGFLSYSGSTFDITNSHVILNDMHITQGGFNFSASGYGGGIDAIYNSYIELNNCEVYDNFCRGNGGGIYLYDSQLHLSDTLIYSNSSYNATFAFGDNGCGGGIYASKSDVSADEESKIFLNYAVSKGGGIAVNESALDGGPNFSINDNISLIGGGGVYADNANVLLKGTNTYLGIFYLWSGLNRCTNGNGGGAYIANSDIVLSGAQCYAQYNYSTANGGAFYLTNSTLKLLDGAEIDFGIADAFGGGINSINSTIFTEDASFYNCHATHGGAIFSSLCTGVFNNTKFIANEADDSIGVGGAIFATEIGVYNFANSVIAGNDAVNAGGIYCNLQAGKFVLDNTQVVSNRAFHMIGGIYLLNSPITFETRNGSSISYNLSDDAVGGAFIRYAGKFLFVDTEISHNVASNNVGGIAALSGAKVECVDCNMDFNIADLNTNGNGLGGAIYIGSLSSLELISSNKTFTVNNNKAAFGGGIIANINSDVSVIGDVLFASNQVTELGGAIFATNLCSISLMPTNGVAPRFVDNLANNNGGAIAIYGGSELTAANTKFENNVSSNYAGAIYIYESTATVYGVFYGSETMPPCSFIGNNARYGGGIYLHYSSLLNISDSLFLSNSAYYSFSRGGALRANLLTVVNMQNSIIAHNSASQGGGIGLTSSASMQMLNCSVVENTNDGIDGNNIAITNSIIWGNSGTQVPAGQTVDYCDVEGGYATGNGNIDAQPLFVNPAALDFRLAANSPCIDTGAVINVNNDCIGDTRPIGAGFDLGAYEFDPPAQLNVIPTELDFGDVAIGDDADLSLSVENLGNQILSGDVINVMVPIFSVESGVPYSVAGFSSNVVTFRFSPISETSITNTVTFQSNGGNENVTLIGTGIPEPSIYLYILGTLVLFFKNNKL